ncbi:MAG: glycosyltransferase family 39 protein [Anaerolineae bacterium]|nr:glycosyltransferase family 39 protein [Anaerolineae bacterium]
MGVSPNTPTQTSRFLRRVVHLTNRFPHLGLYLILAIFFMLATLHSLIVPITQGEDELAHYRYISFIAQISRLPINEAEREQAWYRADWPPLYHLLVGWAVSPLDLTQPRLKDVGEAPHRRLVGEIFYPRLIIYTEDVAWPWQDGILAWHLGRFISILFSAAALVFTYFTVLELCRAAQDRALPCFSAAWLPCLTTALLAFTPRYLFTSAMLGDDSLFILLSAVFIWLLLRALRDHDRWWLYAALGLLLGLSIATKYSTGLLPLVIIPVVWWRARQMGWRWPRWLGRLAVAWGGVIIGAGWWFGWISYHFNTIKEDGPVFGLLNALLNTGPDVSMRRIFALFTNTAFTGQERPAAIAAGTFGDWVVYLFQTFWGVPVLEHDPLFPWAYLPILIFCLLSGLGLWQLWRAANNQTRFTLAILALIVALLLPFPLLRFFLTRNVLETGQGRHILYPAAQAIPILLMLGWGRLWTWGQIKSYTLVALPPLFLLLWSIFQIGHMAVTYPPPLPVQTTTFNPASIPHPLAHHFGPNIQLLGYDLTPEEEPGLSKLTLFWKSQNPVHENYRVQIQLLDPAGHAHLTWLSHPLNGRYPTRAWDQGDVVRDEIPLPLTGLPPGRYTIQVDLLREAANTPLTDPPLALTEFDLPTRHRLSQTATLDGINYHLWLDDIPARHRQTLPLSWNAPGQAQNLAWSLLGPDDVPRSPETTGDGAAVFIVGPDWPSGDYRLQLQTDAGIWQTEPLLTVANEARLFSLPPLPEGYVSLEASFANALGEPQVKLLGFVLPTCRAEPGGGLPLTLYWQSLAPVLGNYIVFDVLLDENQQAYGGYDRLPREYYSTILWAAGEVIEDGFVVPVSPDAPPGIYHLHLGLYLLDGGVLVSLPLLHEGKPADVTSIVIGPLKVGGPPSGVTTTVARPQVALKQSFNHQITLLGYDLNLANEDQLELTLYWQAETTLPTDYTTFLHLRDEANQTVAQKDSPPANGRYPTSLWEAGEIIIDEIILPLDQLPAGQYTPVIGLYDLTTGARLPTVDIPENELRLESIILP